MPPSAASDFKWPLDYKRFTPAELRRFIKDRSGGTLSSQDVQGLQEAGRLKLTSRLRQMDRESTFTCFMELSPELRLTVYEYLLIDRRMRHGNEAEEKETDWRTSKEDFQIHPAVLRTSKLVCSEPQPIVYKKNKSGVKIGYSYPEARPAGKTECDLRILRPGHRFAFFQRAAKSRHTLAIQHLFESPVSTMLGMLEHVSIDLG